MILLTVVKTYGFSIVDISVYKFEERKMGYSRWYLVVLWIHQQVREAYITAQLLNWDVPFLDNYV